MKKHCATEAKKKIENEQNACWRSSWKRQNKHCKTPDKSNAVCLFMGTNRVDFSTSLTPELSGARFCASDLNAKLDLGDEPEECHGLTTSASCEIAPYNRNKRKKTQTNKAPEKANAV